jgi:hypothetical protein
MNTDKCLSFAEAVAGISIGSSTSAWAWSEWVTCNSRVSRDIAIVGITFERQTSPAAADTTYEAVLEIGTGYAGEELTKIQMPFSCRADTITSANNGLGYWMPRAYSLFLPEPFEVTLGTRLAMRVANSVAAAITYAGIRLRYMAIDRIEQPQSFEKYSYLKSSGLSVTERIR